MRHVSTSSAARIPPRKIRRCFHIIGCTYITANAEHRDVVRGNWKMPNIHCFVEDDLSDYFIYFELRLSSRKVQPRPRGHKYGQVPKLEKGAHMVDDWYDWREELDD